MKQVAPFADSPFDDPNFSSGDFLLFSTDHLGRMRGMNLEGGLLDERISITDAAITRFKEALKQDQTALGIRKSRKLTKKRMRVSLRGDVERVVAGVISHFGRKSPEFKKVVPHGREIFNTAPDHAIGDHLGNLVTSVTKLKDKLGPDLGSGMVALATELRDSWQTVSAESNEATGRKAATEEAKREARADLSWVMYENLMTLVSIYPRQRDKVGQFFRPWLLGKKT